MGCQWLLRRTPLPTELGWCALKRKPCDDAWMSCGMKLEKTEGEDEVIIKGPWERRQGMVGEWAMCHVAADDWSLVGSHSWVMSCMETRWFSFVFFL